MWKFKLFNSANEITEFLNANEIKPENCKIMPRHGTYNYVVFYYLK